MNVNTLWFHERPHPRGTDDDSPITSRLSKRAIFDFVVDDEWLPVLLARHLGESESEWFWNGQVSRFGWGSMELDLEDLARFREGGKTDFEGRVRVLICPLCGDPWCGSISIRIDFINDRVLWEDFAEDVYEDDGTGYGPVPHLERLTGLRVEFASDQYNQALADLELLVRKPRAWMDAASPSP